CEERASSLPAPEAQRSPAPPRKIPSPLPFPWDCHPSGPYRGAGSAQGVGKHRVTKYPDPPNWETDPFQRGLAGGRVRRSRGLPHVDEDAGLVADLAGEDGEAGQGRAVDGPA